MAHVVIMPKQGQSVESCIVSEFKKKPGDQVAVGDILFGYETDKATFEEEAKVAGTVLAVFFKDGDEIPVLTNVMVIGEPGESFAEFAPNAGSPAEAPAPAASEGKAAGTPEGTPSTTVSQSSTPPSAGAGPLPLMMPGVAQVSEGTGAPASPRARKIAAEKGVDTSRVAGTGPHGRIIARDEHDISKLLSLMK